MRLLNRLQSLAILLAAFAGFAVAQTPDGGRKIRNVTPENIPVIILPPRPELNKNQKTQHDQPIPGDGIVVSISDEGVVTANGKALHFIGVTRIPTDLLCEAASGGRWACGLRAFVALRNLVHNKEIHCEAIAERQNGTLSRCYRERIHISEWLLSEGWALYDETTKDEALEKATQEAQKQARGIWANGSRPISKK